jgi:hypothetical protein
MEFNNPKVISQLLTMLNYQKQLNDVFDPQWRVNRHQYLRAVVVEGGEAIDHHGYKWWKLQNKDLPQMQLEVVDILHFYLSETARLHLENDEAVLHEEWLNDEKVIRFDDKNYLIKRLSLLEKIELIIGLAVSRRMSWALFRAIQEDVELDFAALHHQYAAKNVLNLLRQRHGDKKGEYIKVWEGEEDNVHLSRQMEVWAEDETMDVLYGRLEGLYKTLALKAA